jgi:sugar lactone lactonase YvrE
VPAQNVALGTISGIAWDPSGNIVFCDTTYNVIRRVDTNGIIETIAGGTGVTGFAGDGGPASGALINSPTLAHYDPSGNLYFYDSSNLRVRKIDTNGVITSIAGDGQFPVAGLDATGPALARSIRIADLAVDASGNVYLAGNGNILRVTPSGNLAIFAQIQSPQVDGNRWRWKSVRFLVDRLRDHLPNLSRWCRFHVCKPSDERARS